MIILIFIFWLRLPIEWLAALIPVGVYQFDTPENLVAALAAFISLETLALGFSVKAYIAQRDKYDTMLEKMLTVNQETKAALEDNTEAIEVLAGKSRGRGARNERNKKTP